jgi:hypothetical protein
MKRDNRRQDCRPGALATSTRGRSRPASTLAVEPLEARQLLSIYLGPTKSRPFFSGDAFYQITLTGPGFQTVSPLGKGFHKVISINLTGTTSESQLSVTLRSPLTGFGKQNTQLQIGRINVLSGQLGGINAAGTADLLGSITPLKGGIQTLAFNSLGPNAQIDVGSVGTFRVGSINLSPNGLVHIAGDATGPFNVGSLNLDGGKFLIDHNASGGLSIGSLDVTRSGQFVVRNDVSGSASIGSLDADGGLVLVGHDVTVPLAVGSITVQNAGQFIVGHDLTGGLQVAGAEKVVSNGLVQVGHNLGGLTVGQSLTLDTSGKLTVGNDVTGPVNIGSDLTLSNNALLSVGRDVLAGVNIAGNLILDSGGSLSIGRDLGALNVNGDVRFTPTAGTITVLGNVNGLTINGVYQGRNNTTAPELSVGLNLTNFTVLHGAPGKGSVNEANIDVGKNIVGLNIQHGIFNSLITAGVLIDGSPQNTTGGNLGPDAFDAVFDSEIRAGIQIRNLLITGDVRSDYVTNPNPTGFRTRIVAGEDRQGRFVSGGNIDNFQITGTLVDAVLAASVLPNPSTGTYDQPAGPNFTAPPFANVPDPVLPGSINASFAPTASQSPTQPTKSTVLGGVVSTSHANNPNPNDFAGIFALDTRGVIVGPSPG